MMDLESAFDQLQENSDAPMTSVASARERRDIFRTTLGKASDVKTVKPIGSLARGTHNDPIHDVDLVVEYKLDDHPDWLEDGDSSENALKYVGQQINNLLGATNGTHENLVRLASPRNHAVKCFIDDPDDEDAFTVDVVPGIRKTDGTLWIPERANGTWVQTAPEVLIEAVATRHAEWNQFAKLIRVLKRWSRENDTGMKKLLIEVMALTCLQKSSSRYEAVAGYFTSAHYLVGQDVQDPAGLCGSIQPDLDVEKARTTLAFARNSAQKALDAAARDDEAAALSIWESVFKNAYPSVEIESSPDIPFVILPSRTARDEPQG